MPGHEPRRRLRLRINGQVQGVGFRPLVFGLAQRLGLTGFVRNDSFGVLIEVEGEQTDIFVSMLRKNPPMLARIEKFESEGVALQGDADFSIKPSGQGAASTRPPTDFAICKTCLDETFDPKSRFYHYPFTACTQCGPRYAMLRALPYDRPHTALDDFPMCADCARDYADPKNRRFHAQPIACARCGPRLSRSPQDIAAAISQGKIIALKGVGGYHLLCDAWNQSAVQKLRARKRRDAKPFAVMARNEGSLDFFAAPTARERGLFAAPSCPVVLMKAIGALPAEIAPKLSRIGLIAPYTAAHHLIFHFLCDGAPRQAPTLTAFVATSANVSGAPIIADDFQAREQLGEIADVIVSHDRAIVTPIDDSVAAIIDGAPSFIRRARGFAPEPIDLGVDGPNVLACGAHLKSTVTVTRGREAFVSQYIGDLDSAASYRRFCECADHLLKLLNVRPQAAACDAHPDFLSRRFAQDFGAPLTPFQHHGAHIAAIAAEHRHDGPLLGVALDGYGYGANGEAWGGELMLVRGDVWRRLGHFAPMPAPGGDKAAQQPWRMGVAALAMVGRLDEADAFFKNQLQCAGLRRYLENGEKMQQTTSLGRLFDAVAALLGLSEIQDYEGQAAMMLEAQVKNPRVLPDGFTIKDNRLDFTPFLRFLVQSKLSAQEGAELFHGTLIAGIAQWIFSAANAAPETMGAKPIALGGGCMMNKILTEGLCDALRAAGFTPLLARAVPANDGGLSLGQAYMARALLSRS